MATKPMRRFRAGNDLADAFGVRPFVAPGCARCRAPLADEHGNPRWEVVGKLTFVCLGGCRPARKAALP